MSKRSPPVIRRTIVGAVGVSLLISTCSTAEVAVRCVPVLQATAKSLMMWV